MEEKEDMKGRPFNYLRLGFITAERERLNALQSWPLKTELAGKREAPETVDLHCMQITAAILTYIFRFKANAEIKLN